MSKTIPSWADAAKINKSANEKILYDNAEFILAPMTPERVSVIYLIYRRCVKFGADESFRPTIDNLVTAVSMIKDPIKRAASREFINKITIATIDYLAAHSPFIVNNLPMLDAKKILAPIEASHVNEVTERLRESGITINDDKIISTLIQSIIVSANADDLEPLKVVLLSVIADMINWNVIHVGANNLTAAEKAVFS